jgi:hypothetical protein
MALNSITTGSGYRPVGFGILGLFLLMFSGFVVYDVVQRKSDVAPVAAAYEYKVSQSVDSDVTYFNSSFFDKNAGTNNAFVSSLTDKLVSTFHYSYHASEPTELAYTYEVKAVVRGTFALQNNGQLAKPSNVWTKEYQLVAPIKTTVTTDDITLDPLVTVPYSDYKKQIEQIKDALSLPLTSEVVVQMLVSVSGSIGGTPFTDVRSSSVTASLDQQIYALAIKYDKADTKRVTSQETQKSKTVFEKYETIIAAVLGFAGLASLIYGFRKQIFKTPYQRELDRIYRYHDGIIIKARQPADLSGKHVVPVLSFEDMLNIEEELKMPIVASPAGTEATQFIIIRDDVAYIYTLGKLLIEEDVDETIVEELTPKKSTHHRKQ